MLLLSVVIHAMMQQLTVAEGFDCSGVSCTKDCPLNLRQMTRDGPTSEMLNEPHAKEFYNSQSRPDGNSLSIVICCRMKCRDSCVTSFNEIVPNGETWMNPEDPCTSHICNNGVISNHTSACAGLPCLMEHYVYRDDKCCPTCDPSWASFCPEDEYCDMACRYGFKRDTQRGCDFCSCKGRSAETTTSSTPTPTTTVYNPSTLIDDEAQTTRTVKFYLYFDPTDGATKNLLIGISITCFVILVACLAAIGWYFHRKVYKRVQLLSNSSA